jgi:hypothetical protein
VDVGLYLIHIKVMHPIETSSKLRNKKCGLGAQKGYRAWYHSTDACSFDGIEPAKPVGD